MTASLPTPQVINICKFEGSIAKNYNASIYKKEINLTGEYGRIRMAKFVRWLHWQTVLL